MDEQRGHACDFGGAQCAQDGIAQQCGAQTPLLMSDVNRQAAEDDRRNRIGPVAPEIAWSLGLRHGARGQAVVADDVLFFAHHIGA
jgi:hypothetical protein